MKTPGAGLWAGLGAAGTLALIVWLLVRSPARAAEAAQTPALAPVPPSAQPAPSSGGGVKAQPIVTQVIPWAHMGLYGWSLGTATGRWFCSARAWTAPATAGGQTYAQGSALAYHGQAAAILARTGHSAPEPGGLLDTYPTVYPELAYPVRIE
jgi:hypothetical protein